MQIRIGVFLVLEDGEGVVDETEKGGAMDELAEEEVVPV